MGQRTILLADDEPDHAQLIRRAIEQVRSDCRVDVVTDGAEVIDYLFAAGTHAGRSSAQPPDLILLDVKMPKMDGLQVLQVLRRVCSDDFSRVPPVVILTASKEEIDIVEAYRLGAHSYIHKPVEFSRLSDAVGKIVNYWLDLNQGPPARRSNGPAIQIPGPGVAGG